LNDFLQGNQGLILLSHAALRGLLHSEVLVPFRAYDNPAHKALPEYSVSLRKHQHGKWFRLIALLRKLTDFLLWYIQHF
jgi:hypothetical protein